MGSVSRPSGRARGAPLWRLGLDQDATVASRAETAPQDAARERLVVGLCKQVGGLLRREGDRIHGAREEPAGGRRGIGERNAEGGRQAASNPKTDACAADLQ